MRFHLFPLFFVTTADAAVWNNFLRFFTRLKNQIHGITGVQNPHLSLGRVQFQHRLKCIVEIGQDFIDILQKKKFKVSRGLSFNLPVIDEKLPDPNS